MTKLWLNLSIVVGLVFMLATPVLAGFQEGLDAADRGDYHTAVKEFQLSAEGGDVKARYNLGVMYDKGKGVPKDYVLAHMRTNLAAAQGVKEAVKGRDLLEKLMTLNQRASGSIPARPTNKIKYLDPSLSTPLSVGASLVARPSGRKKTSSGRHGGDVCPPALNPSSWGYWTILELLRWKVPA